MKLPTLQNNLEQTKTMSAFEVWKKTGKRNYMHTNTHQSLTELAARFEITEETWSHFKQLTNPRRKTKAFSFPVSFLSIKLDKDSTEGHI